MSHSSLSPSRYSHFCAAVFAFFFALSLSAYAQSTASCSFKLFPLNTVNSVNDMNKWGTVVGQVATSPGTPPYGDGFVRYSDGSITRFSPPDSIGTWLNARNDGDLTVGFYFDSTETPHGFSLQGSTVTAITDPDAEPLPTSTRPTGINNSNTIVGQYVSKRYGEFFEGFERHSDGSIVTLAYPGGRPTYPNAINDQGTVVGEYYDVDYIQHGFIWSDGWWSTIDYLQTPGTALLGISNTNVMLGTGFLGPFLYKNGQFENLPGVPNSSSTEFDGMSPNGLITGWESDSGGKHGFIAKCE